jgi:hypothetical protein
MRYAEASCQFIVEETFPGAVGLEPFAINQELGDGTFARAADYLVGSAWSGFNVDLLVGNVVSGEETLCSAAVGTPQGRVEGYVHARSLMLFDVSG